MRVSRSKFVNTVRGTAEISGAAGTCLGVREFGRRIAFEDVPTAGP